MRAYSASIAVILAMASASASASATDAATAPDAATVAAATQAVTSTVTAAAAVTVPVANAAAVPIASVDEETLFNKIRSQGVPEHGLRKIFEYLHQTGHSFPVDYYTCTNAKENNLAKPCEEGKRVSATKSITLEAKDYAVVVDFMRPSTQKRFFLINLKTGSVTSYLSTHGRGSGVGQMAYRFSNTKDSEQSSLGMYVTGETYVGEHGLTLRLYGLEKSNDNAYERDIVLHGAYYADESFFKKIDYNTKKPYTRLGLSWGCPAVSIDNAKKLIPILQGGALIYLDQPELADAALSGNQVESGAGVLSRIQNRPVKKVEVAPVPAMRPAYLRAATLTATGTAAAGVGAAAEAAVIQNSN